MTPNPLLGATLLSIGGCSSALCYTPQKRTRGWSWQTYWLAQALVCWFILPWICAWFTTPHLMTVLSEAPARVMVNTILLGALFGVGGTAFGIAIRYIGFSITYAIAIGISCVLGTLFTPLLSGKLAVLLVRTGTGWVLGGVAVATIGILVFGLAGWFKDADLRNSDTMPEGFHFGKGLFFCVLAGVLSAVFGISLDVGKPIAVIAAAHGAGQFEGNVVYIFSCGGAFFSTAVYCLFLHIRQTTLGEYIGLPAGDSNASLPVNFAMAGLTGLLWYGQFFLYGLGQVRMGEYKFTSWAINNAMIVFFSAMVGLLMREWKGCRPRTWAALVTAFILLIVAVGLMTYGNYIGSIQVAQEGKTLFDAKVHHLPLISSGSLGQRQPTQATCQDSERHCLSDQSGDRARPDPPGNCRRSSPGHGSGRPGIRLRYRFSKSACGTRTYPSGQVHG